METDYFDIVAGVLQRDTLAPYHFIICLDYVLRTSIDKVKDNGFKLTKGRSRRYPTQTTADYSNDIVLLANTPAQSETLLHCLEKEAGGIGLHVKQTRRNTRALIKEATSPHKIRVTEPSWQFIYLESSVS